jgi:hypothetical protein
MFQAKVVEKIKTHILFSIMFSRKSCHLWDNVEKYGLSEYISSAPTARILVKFDIGGFYENLSWKFKSG